MDKQAWAQTVSPLSVRCFFSSFIRVCLCLPEHLPGTTQKEFPLCIALECRQHFYLLPSFCSPVFLFVFLDISVWAQIWHFFAGRVLLLLSNLSFITSAIIIRNWAVIGEEENFGLNTLSKYLHKKMIKWENKIHPFKAILLFV